MLMMISRVTSERVTHDTRQTTHTHNTHTHTHMHTHMHTIHREHTTYAPTILLRNQWCELGRRTQNGAPMGRHTRRRGRHDPSRGPVLAVGYCSWVLLLDIAVGYCCCQGTLSVSPLCPSVPSSPLLSPLVPPPLSCAPPPPRYLLVQLIQKHDTVAPWQPAAQQLY